MSSYINSHIQDPEITSGILVGLETKWCVRCYALWIRPASPIFLFKNIPKGHSVGCFLKVQKGWFSVMHSELDLLLLLSTSLLKNIQSCALRIVRRPFSTLKNIQSGHSGRWFWKVQKGVFDVLHSIGSLIPKSGNWYGWMESYWVITSFPFLLKSCMSNLCGQTSWGGLDICPRIAKFSPKTMQLNIRPGHRPKIWQIRFLRANFFASFIIESPLFELGGGGAPPLLKQLEPASEERVWEIMIFVRDSPRLSGKI